MNIYYDKDTDLSLIQLRGEKRPHLGLSRW